MARDKICNAHSCMNTLAHGLHFKEFRIASPPTPFRGMTLCGPACVQHAYAQVVSHMCCITIISNAIPREFVLSMPWGPLYKHLLWARGLNYTRCIPTLATRRGDSIRVEKDIRLASSAYCISNIFCDDSCYKWLCPHSGPTDPCDVHVLLSPFCKGLRIL